MTDGQGTTKLETNSSQTTTSTQETEAFGRTIGTTGSTGSSYGYHGGEGYRQDGDGPAGLEPYQKVGARYYDATFGRFLTRDTDLSQSPYAYCNGDPVNESDPSGHEAGLPATFETMAHDGIAGLMDGIERGDGFDIPVGNAGKYNPQTDTFTFNPITYQGGSTTFGPGKITSSPEVVGNGSLNVAGGDLTFNGNYPLNGSGGSFQGQYSHPISGGLNIIVQFGTKKSPTYGLSYGLSF